MLNYKIQVEELLIKYKNSDIYSKYENNKNEKYWKLTELIENEEDKNKKDLLLKEKKDIKFGLNIPNVIGLNLKTNYIKKSNLSEKILTEKKVNGLFDKLNNLLDINNGDKDKEIKLYYKYLYYTYHISNEYINFKTGGRLKDILGIQSKNNLGDTSFPTSYGDNYSIEYGEEEPERNAYNYWKAIENDITWENSDWDPYENQNFDPYYGR